MSISCSSTCMIEFMLRCFAPSHLEEPIFGFNSQDSEWVKINISSSVWNKHQFQSAISPLYNAFLFLQGIFISLFRQSSFVISRTQDHCVFLGIKWPVLFFAHFRLKVDYIETRHLFFCFSCFRGKCVIPVSNTCSLRLLPVSWGTQHGYCLAGELNISSLFK